MKALLLSKYRHLEIVDLPNPIPGPGEILVKVAACGICGSDLHGYDCVFHLCGERDVPTCS